MKTSDFLRIARLSIKSHKKQTNNIVRGLSLAAVLLIPVLFIFFSFYIGTLAKIDSLKVISSLRLSYQKEAAGINLALNDFKKVNSLSGIENSAVYSVYTLNASYQKVVGVFEYETVDLTPAVSFDGEEYKISGYSEVNFELYDFDKTDSVVSEAEEAYLKKSGYGKAIPAGEILNGKSGGVTISSKLLDELNIPYDYVIGKTASFSIELYGGQNAYYADRQSVAAEGERITILGDFTVTGVFNAKLYSSPSRKGASPLFWLDKKALTETPYLPRADGDNFIYADTLFSLSEKSKNAGFIFLPFGFNGLTEYASGFKQILQFDGFKSLYGNIDAVINLAGEGDGDYMFVNCAAETFQEFYDSYPFLQTVSIIILFFAIAILITVLLNIYNTVQYSVYNRKSYLKMLSALGMKAEDIKKLYLAETILTVFKSLIITAGISFALCAILIFLFNGSLSSFTAELPIALTLNLIYYIPSFFITAAAVLIFSIGISFFCIPSKSFKALAK